MTQQSRSIGVHVSIAGHLKDAVERANAVGCVRTFQIFSCSPRRWNAAPLDKEETRAFKLAATSAGYSPFCHMPYLPNLCSPDDHFYSQSVDVLVREILRCEELGIDSLVLHFGSHGGTSVDDGHDRLIKACKKAIASTDRSKVRILLENSAGIKNSVGSTFSQIKSVFERIGAPERLGVCFDTCHAFASGYDIRDSETVNVTMSEFDSILGINNLRLIHLNDSKGVLGGALDRHEDIGRGKIGTEGFRALLNLHKLRDIPIVLETPYEKEGDDRRNLERVKSLLLD